MAGYLLSRLWERLSTPISSATKHPTAPTTNLEFSTQQYDHSGPPFKYPMIRFNAVTGNIYGFPGGQPGSRLEIIQPAYAQICYILGPGWQSKIIEYCSDGPKSNFIPMSNDPTDEAIHCLRMRRCGAKHLIRQHSGLPRYLVSNWEHMQKVIFGWPDDGGVWVLRLPDVLFAPRDTPEAQLEYLENVERWTDPDFTGGHPALLRRLQQQEDMRGYCAVLESEGAVFYSGLAECPEVLEFGLVDIEANQRMILQDV